MNVLSWLAASAFVIGALLGLTESQDYWRVEMLGEVESVGQPGEDLSYFSLSSDEPFVIMGSVSHRLIRFLEARRGQTVTITITGGVPE